MLVYVRRKNSHPFFFVLALLILNKEFTSNFIYILSFEAYIYFSFLFNTSEVAKLDTNATPNNCHTIELLEPVSGSLA